MNLSITLGFNLKYKAFDGGSDGPMSEAFFVYTRNGGFSGSVEKRRGNMSLGNSVNLGMYGQSLDFKFLLMRDGTSKNHPSIFHGYREPQLSGGVSCASKIGSDSNQHKQTPNA